MTRLAPVIISLVAWMAAVACQQAANDVPPEEIIALERAALDRWGKGDPQGYLEIMAPEVTYFDPNLEKRIDGLEAMKAFLAPLTGKIRVDRYDMLSPKVQQHGDVAVLTFNLVSQGTPPGGSSTITVRWNSTETYRRIDGNWRLVHSHWSFTKPELRQPLPGAP